MEPKEELDKILDTMDVPPLRRDDLMWLGRNLGVRNVQHKDFERAWELIKILQKKIRTH